MKTFKATALFAIAALGMASPTMAASFATTGPNPHYANGHLTASGFGQNYDCRIDMLKFSASSSSMTTEPYPILVNDHGGPPTYQRCDDILGTFTTLEVVPFSTTKAIVPTFDLDIPFALCIKYNVQLNWTNGAIDSMATGSNIPIGFCTLSSLTLTFERIRIV